MIQERTYEILKDNGWFEGRKIEFDKETKELEIWDYEITDAFQKFYAEFGRLKFQSKNRNGIYHFITFDLADCWWLINNETIVNDYPKIIPCKHLTFIGRLNGENSLVINEHGHIYSIHDGTVVVLGKGIHAIDTLINKEWQDIPQLPIPDWW